MTRAILKSIAPLVEALELEAASVVTTSHLHELAEAAGLRTPTYVAIQRLASQGWLIATDVRGVWEFAPGAHAGPYGSGDALITMRAQLAVMPELDIRVALESALWLHGLADRPPDRHCVTVPAGSTPPAAIRRNYNVVRFDAVLPAASVDRLPVCVPPTVLVHVADHPTAVRNWRTMLDALADLVDATDPSELDAELEGRSNATRQRLGYLIDPIDPDLASTIEVADTGTAWFGPRREVRRRSAKWNVVDTVLPEPPGGDR